MPNYSTHLAAYAEMQDAAKLSVRVVDAPAAASIELAKLLTRFESQIKDDWRAIIIHIGGGLLRLDCQLNQKTL